MSNDEFPADTTDYEAPQYTGWTEEDAAANDSEVGEGGKTPFWSPKVGRNLVRMLPGLGTNKPMIVSHQHYIELPGRPKVVFACPKALEKKPCPACTKSEQLMASKNQADRETAFGLKPRLRVYANIVDRGDVAKGPQVWGFGRTVYDQLRSLRADPDVGDFFRIDASGFDIVVERKGTGKNDTEYHVRPSAKNLALGDASVLEVQSDLQRFRSVMEYDAIVAKLRGDQQGGGAPRNLPPTTSAPRAPQSAPAPAPAGAADAFGF